MYFYFLVSFSVDCKASPFLREWGQGKKLSKWGKEHGLWKPHIKWCSPPSPPSPHTQNLTFVPFERTLGLMKQLRKKSSLIEISAVFLEWLKLTFLTSHLLYSPVDHHGLFLSKCQSGKGTSQRKRKRPRIKYSKRNLLPFLSLLSLLFLPLQGFDVISNEVNCEQW